MKLFSLRSFCIDITIDLDILKTICKSNWNLIDLKKSPVTLMLSSKYKKILHCDVQPPNDDIWRNHLIIVGVHLGNVAGNGVDWLKAVVAPWGGCEKCPFGILFCFHLWHWWNFNDTQRMLPKRIFSKQFKFVEDGKCWHVLSATRDCPWCHPSVWISLCCFFPPRKRINAEMKM